MTTGTHYSTKKVDLAYEERDGKAGSKVTYQDGYVSWAPADVIQRDYQPADALSFGHAIHALKAGERVARRGWNGKGMFIYLIEGSFDAEMLGFGPGEQPAPGHPTTLDGVSLGLLNAVANGGSVRLPHIAMQTASGSTLDGWLASQTDLLADDWMIV